jgi:hypothetical protein
MDTQLNGGQRSGACQPAHGRGPADTDFQTDFPVSITKY